MTGYVGYLYANNDVLTDLRKLLEKWSLPADLLVQANFNVTLLVEIKFLLFTFQAHFAKKLTSVILIIEGRFSDRDCRCATLPLHLREL